MRFPVPTHLSRILHETPILNQAYLVGGCVRDWLLNQGNKDFDIEVFGVDYESLANALARWGRTDLVGRSFGAVKLTTKANDTYDFTIPRRDSKVAPGHKGFEIQFDPSISPEEAASRRDFTINALMYDPREHRILDFFGGREDLGNRILRHTSEAFVEDPLRVLRGMQLTARFNLKGAEETIQVCQEMQNGYLELAKERVREEWFKWASKSVTPSAGLRFLRDTSWIDHYPEIKALIDTPQDPEWHPEGDVFVHTCHCCDAMAQLPEWQHTDESSRIVYMLAILGHDFAKPQTTHKADKNGQIRIVSPGHESEGGPIADQFLEKIDAPSAIRARVIPLVTNHLAHLHIITDRSVRRLAKRLEPDNIEGLCTVMTADHMGRPPKPAVVPEGVIQIRAKAAELQVQESAPKPILQGRHLIQIGMRPSKDFGVILNSAFEAQLEGEITNLPEAWGWLSRQEGLPIPKHARGNIPIHQ